jgi:hypothetical protein
MLTGTATRFHHDHRVSHPAAAEDPAPITPCDCPGIERSINNMIAGGGRVLAGVSPGTPLATGQIAPKIPRHLTMKAPKIPRHLTMKDDMHRLRPLAAELGAKESARPAGDLPSSGA